MRQTGHVMEALQLSHCPVAWILIPFPGRSSTSGAMGSLVSFKRSVQGWKFYIGFCNTAVTYRTGVINSQVRYLHSTLAKNGVEQRYRFQEEEEETVTNIPFLYFRRHLASSTSRLVNQWETSWISNCLRSGMHKSYVELAHLTIISIRSDLL